MLDEIIQDLLIPVLENCSNASLEELIDKARVSKSNAAPYVFNTASGVLNRRTQKQNEPLP